jgi:hypothetical protein
MVLSLEIICSANFAEHLPRLQIRQICGVSIGLILLDRSFLRQHEHSVAVIRRFGVFVNNVILGPIGSGDSSREAEV